MDIIVIGGFCLSVLGLVGAALKFVTVQLHGRITEVKKDLEREISEIKENYAHKDSIDSIMKQILGVMDDVKKEQHRMAQRMDDFAKWVTELVVSRDKK